MSAPRLSVTVTNYNYGRFLAQAIESILGQRFADFELILIDNVSEDDSVDVMRGYERSDPRVRVIVHDQNLGMIASLMEGFDQSRGTYRVQVDADDWVLSPDAFGIQVAMLDANPDMAFVYSSLTQIGTTARCTSCRVHMPVTSCCLARRRSTQCFASTSTTPGPWCGLTPTGRRRATRGTLRTSVTRSCALASVRSGASATSTGRSTPSASTARTSTSDIRGRSSATRSCR